MSDNEEDREPIPDPDVKPGTEASDPEPPTADGEISEQESSDSDEQEAPKPKKASRRDRRIAELHAASKAKDAEIERLMRLAQGQTSQPKPSADDPAPSEDQFDDYQAFLRADARWAARQEYREQASKQASQAAKERDQRNTQALEAKWEESHEAAIDEHEDYEELFDVVGKSINGDQAMAVKYADDPAAVVYYLGKNPKELAKFRALNDAQLLKAVGRIEERINSQREQRSKAPEPITPSRGAGNSSSNQLSDKMDTKRWMDLRNKQARPG